MQSRVSAVSSRAEIGCGDTPSRSRGSIGSRASAELSKRSCSSIFDLKLRAAWSPATISATNHDTFMTAVWRWMNQANAFPRRPDGLLTRSAVTEPFRREGNQAPGIRKLFRGRINSRTVNRDKAQQGERYSVAVAESE